MLGHKRNRLLSTTLVLSAVAFIHTGCTQQQQYISKEAPQVVQSQLKATVSTPHPKSNLQTSDKKIDVECNDDKTLKETCDRGEIRADQLTGKNLQHTSVGVVHALKSIQGHKIKIIERPTGFLFPNYRGKVIILVMFGKDCPHCVKEIPILRKIKQRYPGQIEVIAVQTQDRMAPYTAKAYINQHHVNYPIIEGDDATDLQYFIQGTYGWTGILPFSMVIKEGTTELTYSGTVSYDEIKMDMDTLFNRNNKP